MHIVREISEQEKKQETAERKLMKNGHQISQISQSPAGIEGRASIEVRSS